MLNLQVVDVPLLVGVGGCCQGKQAMEDLWLTYPPVNIAMKNHHLFFVNPCTPWSKYMAQSPKGRLIQGLYQPIHGNFAIYFYPGVNTIKMMDFLSPCMLVYSCAIKTEKSGESMEYG